MFREVPVLPVVVPIAGLALVMMLWRLHRRDALTVPRASVALAVCVYVAGVLANTVFPIFLDKPARSGPWTDVVNLTPLAGYEVADAVMNMGVFVPIGVLVPLVLRHPTWWRVLGTATVASTGIEISQLVTANLLGGGHVADVNDLLFNVVGAAIGYALLVTLVRSPLVARAVDAFRWRAQAQMP